MRFISNYVCHLEERRIACYNLARQSSIARCFSSFIYRDVKFINGQAFVLDGGAIIRGLATQKQKV